LPEQREIDTFFRNVYEQTNSFYDTIKSGMGEAALGFKILYGPPFANPPLLFLGYQPGGDKEDKINEKSEWPSNCEYATESWPLARQMQKMFGKETLEKSVGINAIFFRAPSVEKYKEINPELRKRISNYCIPQVKQIIRAIKPQKIVAIGLDTLMLFDTSTTDIKNEKGRTIAKLAQIAGYPTIGTLHLSGARISNEDRDLIAQYTLESPYL
jgi:hypothetical protein